MLCAKPVILSENRGHKEIVTNGFDGIIIKPYDSKKLASMIIKIYYDKKFRKKLSMNGLKTAKLFTDINVIKELNALYVSNN